VVFGGRGCAFDRSIVQDLDVRAPSDQFKEKSFLELLPKGRLLAALSLLILLVAVVYAQRHAGRAMDQLKGLVSPPPARETPAGGSAVRRVKVAPMPPVQEKSP
jgi:hypothetical protein